LAESEPKIFLDGPSSERLEKWRLEIASEIGCSVEVVKSAGYFLEIVEWNKSETLLKFVNTEKILVSAMDHFLKAVSHLDQLDCQISEELQKEGSIPDLDTLMAQLIGIKHAINFFAEFRTIPRTGGKNLAAYLVGDVVANIYRMIDRPVTFGQTDGAPSTPFGRSVQHALSVTGISADWRGPAREAWDTESSRK